MYGFTFNDQHSDDFHLIMRSVNRQLLPGNNDAYATIPGRDGGILFASGLKNRTISLKCAIKGSNLEDLRKKARDVAAWLYTKDFTALSFDDETDLHYKAKVASPIDFDNLTKTLGIFDLNFECEPFAYAAEDDQDFANDAAVVVNAGNVIAYPRFVVTFTDSAIEWKVMLGGAKYIRVINNFVANDVLEVNCITGAILLNDTRSMSLLDWENSNLFGLETGENTMAITPTGKCTTKIYWKPRYL